MTTTAAPSTRSEVTRKQKVGLVLAGLYGLINVPSVLTPTREGQEGPPFPILLVDTLLGVVCVVAVVLAWRGNRVALRICAGAMIVLALSALPAFFVGVPMGIKALVGATILWVVVSIAMIFSGPARTE